MIRAIAMLFTTCFNLLSMFNGFAEGGKVLGDLTKEEAERFAQRTRIKREMEHKELMKQLDAVK